MDDNPEQRLKRKKTKHCEKTDRDLKEEYGSRLLKQIPAETTDDSVNSGEQSPIVDDANKQLMDSELDMESIQPQAQLVLPQNYNTQTTLAAFVDRSTIQSDANKKQVVNVTINQQVGDNNGQNEAKLNPTAPEPQPHFTGILPDDFYLHLISVIGIQACLLSNRLVCSLFNDLVLERCHNQKSLKLFETFNCLVEYGELLLKYEKTEDASLILKSIGDDLLFESLETDHEKLVNSLHQKDDDDDEDDVEEKWEEEEDDGEDVQKEVLTREKKLEASKVLTALFPTVEELVLCHEYDTLINIEHLLQFYAKQLTSLTMTYFAQSYESQSRKLRAFSFPLLKALNTFNFSLEEDQLLSLLPQLESLTMERAKMSLETLLSIGTQLQELNVKYLESVYTAQVEEFSKRPPISNILRKFSFVSSENQFQVLEFISQNMISLECLKLDLIFEQDNVSHLHSLTPYLVPLTQLHSLTLEAPVSFFLLDDSQIAEIKPLPSVRQLKLLLWNYASLPRESMDLFSRVLFKAFTNAEHALIAFVGNEDEDEDPVDDGLVEKDTLAAFEDFAGKHPDVVQLFRSRKMSKFTNLPNAVSPLLGKHRQVYEEYIEEEELFGVAICKLAAYLVTQEGQDVPNLKIMLRAADRLTAMSNLFQLMENKAFTLTFEMVRTMIYHMTECALKLGQSEGALYIATCKCILSLLDCSIVDSFSADKEIPYLDTEDVCALDVYSLFELMMNLVKHSKTQQFNDKELLLQLYKCIGKLMKFDSFRDDERFDEFTNFKILLKLAGSYKTQELSVLDKEEELLFLIHESIENHLIEFQWDNRLYSVISKLIRLENRLYRVEMHCALTRYCQSTDNFDEYFKMLSSEDSPEVDSDSSDGDSSDRDLSDSDSSNSTTSHDSSAESES